MAVVKITAKGDASQARTEFDGLGKSGTMSLASLGKAAGVAGAAIGAGLAASIGVAVVATRKALEVAGEWIEAANVQEDAVASLNAALSATDQFTTRLSERYQELASSFQAVTTTGDEELLPLMGRLATVGGVTERSMEAATGAALNLAAGLGKDNKSAFELVAKAASGYTSALTRYGIQVDKGATQSETLNNVIAAIEAKFGGSAAAAAETFSGRVKQINNAWGDLREVGGSVLTTVLEPFVDEIAIGVSKVAEFVNAHKSEVIIGFAKALTFAADATIPLILSGGKFVEVWANVSKLLLEIVRDRIGPLLAVSSKVAEAFDLGTVAAGLQGALKSVSTAIEGYDFIATNAAKKTNELAEAGGRMRARLVEALAGIQEEARRADKDVTELTGQEMVERLRQYGDEWQKAGEKAAAAGEQTARAGDKIDHTAEQLKRWQDAVKDGGGGTEESLERVGSVTQATTDIVVTAAGEVEHRWAAANRFHANVVANMQDSFALLENLSLSFGIGGGSDQFDSNSQAALEAIERLRGNTGGGLVGDISKNAIDAIRSGDLDALEDLSVAATTQADVIPGGTSGNEQVRQDLQGIGAILARLTASLSTGGDGGIGGGFAGLADTFSSEIQSLKEEIRAGRDAATQVRNTDARSLFTDVMVEELKRRGVAFT